MQDKYDFLGFLKKLKQCSIETCYYHGICWCEKHEYSNKFDALNGRVLGR